MGKTESKTGSKTEKRVSTARARAESQGSGFTKHLKLGTAKLFSWKPDTKRYIDILNYKTAEAKRKVEWKGKEYEVGAGKNPNADPGVEHYERTYFLHKNIGPNREAYVCAAKTAGRRCPICDWMAKELKKEEPDDKTLGSLKAQQRQLMNVVDTKEPDAGIQVFDNSTFNLGKAIDERVQEGDQLKGKDYREYDFFADHNGDDAKTLKFMVKEATFAGNKYNTVGSVDMIERETEYGEKILKKLVCLDEIIVIEPYEKLKEIFLAGADIGGETDDDASDDEEDGKEEEDADADADSDADEDKPARKAKGKKSDDDEDDSDDDTDDDDADDDSADDDDSEDSDDDDTEDEDEPEEKPAKKRGRPKGSTNKKDKEEEPDDADEDDDADDAEDKKPVKKGKKPEPAAKSEKKKDADDEDDWDDFDDEDDEDEPKKPAAKGKKSK